MKLMFLFTQKLFKQYIARNVYNTVLESITI